MRSRACSVHRVLSRQLTEPVGEVRLSMDWSASSCGSCSERGLRWAATLGGVATCIGRRGAALDGERGVFGLRKPEDPAGGRARRAEALDGLAGRWLAPVLLMAPRAGGTFTMFGSSDKICNTGWYGSLQIEIDTN